MSQPRRLLVRAGFVSLPMSVLLACAHAPAEPAAPRATSGCGASEATVSPLLIPPPDPKLYTSIRDAALWKNPYLIVAAKGVDLTAGGAERTVPVSALRDALLALPRSAWPYGRVVIVQEASIVAGDGSDDAPIAANLARTLGVLCALDVTVERWPSG